jgi:hypothetical protein
MKWKKWLEKWDMTSLKVKSSFLEMEWKPSEPDKEAAWDLYIELLTRITTQPLADRHGDELTALSSVYSLFPTTRSIMKSRGRSCTEFTKIAVIVLNQIVRPFTARWHGISVEKGLDDKLTRKKFRAELAKLQRQLVLYAKMLADMAGVEDLTQLERPGA